MQEQRKKVRKVVSWVELTGDRDCYGRWKIGGEIWVQGEVEEVGIRGCKYLREGTVTAVEEGGWVRRDGMISAKVSGGGNAPPGVHYEEARGDDIHRRLYRSLATDAFLSALAPFGAVSYVEEDMYHY